jgi:hypothetical protein
MSIQVCSECHKPFNKDGLSVYDLCDQCDKKKEKDIITKFDSDNWIKFINNLKDRDWNHTQLSCPKHQFERVPKSGKYLGISLWRCIFCDGVVQST